MKPRLLLLCPTRTYRAEAFVRAAKRLPAELSIASEVPSALSELCPDTLPFFNFDSVDACADFARGFAGAHGLDAVVAVDDQATLAASVIAETLAIPGNTPDAVRVSRDKHRTREVLTRAGLRQPAFYLAPIVAGAESGIDIVPFPVVTKPIALAASRGVIRADNADAFRAAFARTASIASAPDTPSYIHARTHVLVESYVPGWEVALEGLVTGGRLHVLAIFDKPDPLEGPYFPETFYITPSRLPPEVQEALTEVTQAAISAIGLSHGPIHAELRGTSSVDIVLIEMAARSIGGLCSAVLRFERGLSLEDVILRHNLEMLPRVPPLSDGAHGVMMMQAPRPGVFREMRGANAARAVKGIEAFVPGAHPGRRVLPLPEGFLYVGFLFARGPTAASVEASLREASNCLEMVIDAHA